MPRDYELLICDACDREKVRPTEMTNVVRCYCGADEWRLFDLVPVARDPEERYALVNGDTDALTA
jgi:hypothetical protein